MIEKTKKAPTIPKVKPTKILKKTSQQTLVVYRPYSEALEWSRSLGLYTMPAWKQFCKEGNCPVDIPKQPNKFYKEWLNFDVWLGLSEQKIEKVIKMKDDLEKMIYIYNDTHSPKNLLYFGWAEGTRDDLNKIKGFLSDAQINIIKRYEFEPNIEEFMISIILRNASKKDLTIENLYSGPVIVADVMNVFFEFDIALMPFGFDKPGV